MVAQDIPFIYHPELEGVARERRWYMNGVSWANIVYLFNILTMVAERVTPSPGDAPPGPDSAFNESGVRSPGSMAPDSAFNESGVRYHRWR